jgi:hypothetical protein
MTDILARQMSDSRVEKNDLYLERPGHVLVLPLKNPEATS